MNIENYQKLSREQKVDFLIDFGKKILQKENRRVFLKDFQELGITVSNISNLFGSLSKLNMLCGASFVKRRINMSHDEIRSYIKELAHIEDGGCWVPQKIKPRKDGRFSIYLDGKLMFLYRASYKLFIGPLIPGLLIRHKCDNQKCFNPDHLLQGTHQENSQDMIDRDRLGMESLIKFKKHSLKNPYAYTELLNLVKDRCEISFKNEWLYPCRSNSCPNITFSGKSYKIHRLILANKLGIKYEDVNMACHRFPEGSPFYNDQPQKNDVNPDHLYNGDSTSNTNDAKKYSKQVLLNSDQVSLIRAVANITDFTTISRAQFDYDFSKKLDVPLLCVTKARTGATFKECGGTLSKQKKLNKHLIDLILLEIDNYDFDNKSAREFDFVVGKKLNISPRVIEEVRTGRIYKFFGSIRRNFQKKKVQQFDLNSNLIMEFQSLREASNITRVSEGAISHACNGVSKTAGGFIWKFLKKEGELNESL